MYKENYFIDAAKLPDNSTHIWRYMDFVKFASLIDKSELYFCRSDKFEDPVEGSFPELCTADKICTTEELKKHISQTNFNFRKQTHINCWHQNDYESAGMWNLYAKDNRGIAILSTIGKLKESIIDSRNVYIGKVKYIDYKKDQIPILDFFSPFFYKRMSFAHENEIRALVETSDDLPLKDGHPDYSIDIHLHGLGIKVDLKKMIEAIYIAPFAPSWFVELVKSFNNKYGYNFPMRQSLLADPAMF